MATVKRTPLRTTPTGKTPPHNKRPGNQETLLMTLAMLDMVPKVGKISAPEVRQRLIGLGFDRDLRSIQRQLEALSTQFAIERDDSGKPYGYSWRRDAKGISIPGLTIHESLLLNMAEKYLRNLLPPSLMQAMEGFFGQARRNLGGPLDDKLERRWLDKVRVVSPGVPLLAPEIRAGVLENISQALFRETWLEVDYTNTAGEQRKHRVMPLGLAQQGARMVLVVRFDGHTDARSLAVSRIEQAMNTGLPFPPVTDFELADFDEQGGFGYGRGQTVRLTFRIDKALGLFLTESRLSADQTVVDLGDRLEITATVAQTEHLVWWLRGFGRRAEVLAPAQLVQLVQEA